MAKNVKRLFGQFRPQHYRLFLAPNAQAMDFNGTVEIRGQKVGRPSQRLTFHQKQLRITQATLTKHDKQGDQQVSISRINLHGGFDEVRLHTDQLLYPGDYTVTLTFSGRITRPMNGLYPSYYQENGQEKLLLATQFESHHAREAFPCIDEPEAKATYDLSLATRAGQTVIANTPVARQTTKAGVQTTFFETSPKMSSYLLAFVIGDLAYLESTTQRGIKVRTYTIPAHIKHTKEALRIAVDCLNFYEDYFGIDYPLPKCDLIGLPDFASGAMENWGCITFREACLIIDPKNTSLPVRQYVAMVIAHELAHMWFGNLVTMRWWTDLWLNEGFASWVEYLAVDQLFPQWQMWTQFISDEQQTALRLDALQNTHPVEVPVRHPDEIRTIFDTISYSKGASVIHMLQQYLGADEFREGLRHYLKEHAYGNTVTDDLWAALEKVSGKPVAKFMTAWTGQPGFPLLTAKVDNNGVQAHQQPFLANPQAKPQALTWPVPVNRKLTPNVLDYPDYNWPANHLETLVLNQQQSGFYRTVYNPAHLDNLAQSIRHGQLSPVERLGLLSDVFEAAKAGYCSSIDALSLLNAYTNEDNTAVWDVIAGGIHSLRGVMDDDQLRAALKPFVRRLVARQLRRLGWQPHPKESYFDSLLRPTILGLASHADDTAVVKEALGRFARMKQPEDLPADLRGVIYGTAARHGTQATFDKLLALHNHPDTLSEEKNTLAAAMCAFEQPALIRQALAQIDSNSVRLQDVGYWLAFSFMNRHAKKMTWQWLTKHWDWLEANLGTDMAFARLPMYAGRSFSDASFLPTYRRFFESVMSPSLERSYRQGVEMIEWQSAWKKRDLAAVRKFITAANNSKR